MKTKADYVIDLIRDARADRSSNTSAKRTVKALRQIGLDEKEIVRVMCYLDYCRPDGTPYGVVQRCW